MHRAGDRLHGPSGGFLRQAHRTAALRAARRRRLRLQFCGQPVAQHLQNHRPACRFPLLLNIVERVL
jgi:hypothetical protein